MQTHNTPSVGGAMPADAGSPLMREIGIHRAAVEVDEANFDDDGKAISEEDANISGAVEVSAFNALVNRPCLSAADVQAKVDYFLNGSVGMRNTLLECLFMGQYGADETTVTGNLTALLNSLVLPAEAPQDAAERLHSELSEVLTKAWDGRFACLTYPANSLPNPRAGAFYSMQGEGHRVRRSRRARNYLNAMAYMEPDQRVRHHCKRLMGAMQSILPGAWKSQYVMDDQGQPCAVMIVLQQPRNASSLPPRMKPDAELLELGRLFSAEMEVFSLAKQEFDRTYALWDKAISDRGLNPDETGAKQQAISEQTGRADAFKAMDACCDRLVALSKEIRALTPTTLSGLAVWGRAAAFESQDYEPREVAIAISDMGERQIFDLLGQIERMASRAYGDVPSTQLADAISAVLNTQPNLDALLAARGEFEELGETRAQWNAADEVWQAALDDAEALLITVIDFPCTGIADIEAKCRFLLEGPQWARELVQVEKGWTDDLLRSLLGVSVEGAEEEPLS